MSVSDTLRAAEKVFDRKNCWWSHIISHDLFQHGSWPVSVADTTCGVALACFEKCSIAELLVVPHHFERLFQQWFLAGSTWSPTCNGCPKVLYGYSIRSTVRSPTFRTSCSSNVSHMMTWSKGRTDHLLSPSVCPWFPFCKGPTCWEQAEHSMTVAQLSCQSHSRLMDPLGLPVLSDLLGGANTSELQGSQLCRCPMCEKLRSSAFEPCGAQPFGARRVSRVMCSPFVGTLVPG